MKRSERTVTLFAALRKANLGGALVGMATAGTMLCVLMFFSLRAQVTANLDLIARTIAYSTEAALMFNDRLTSQEILAQIVAREGLEMASITNPRGDLLARVERRSGKAMQFSQMVDRMVFLQPTEVAVISNDQLLGHVRIRGDGEVFTLFFLKMFAAILFSLFLTSVAILLFTRRLERNIVRELDALAKNTLLRHQPRVDGPIRIAEFQQIDFQFQTLLAELDAKTGELLAQQMSLEAANSSLSYRANHDELTHLGNRAYFHRCLEVALAHGGRLALLYLDSDHFKAINDKHGHAVGDMFLVKTAQSIRSAVRHSDVVARLGGDEFAVLLAPLETPEVAARVAEKILATPPLCILDQGKELHFRLAVSIGIAFSPEAGTDSETLLKAADEAMYASKKRGGSCYTIASASVAKDAPS